MAKGPVGTTVRICVGTSGGKFLQPSSAAEKVSPGLTSIELGQVRTEGQGRGHQGAGKIITSAAAGCVCSCVWSPLSGPRISRPTSAYPSGLVKCYLTQKPPLTFQLITPCLPEEPFSSAPTASYFVPS